MQVLFGYEAVCGHWYPKSQNKIMEAVTKSPSEYELSNNVKANYIAIMRITYTLFVNYI